MDQHLVWSLNQCMLGETVTWDAWGYPLANASTRVLADGWRFIFAGLKGDQQYVKKALAFSTSWVSERMCYVCEAGHDMGSLSFASLTLHLRNFNVILACAIVPPARLLKVARLCRRTMAEMHLTVPHFCRMKPFYAMLNDPRSSCCLGSPRLAFGRMFCMLSIYLWRQKPQHA